MHATFSTDWGLLKETSKIPLKEIQTSGALAPQTPCSHRRVSQLACQATAFVCPLRGPSHPREWTHPQRPWRWSEEGAGSHRECNSIAALCDATKEPVRAEDWEWDNQSSADTLGYNRPDAGNRFFGYKFPMEPESVGEHSQGKQVCRSPGNKGGPSNERLELTLLSIFWTRSTNVTDLESGAHRHANCQDITCVVGTSFPFLENYW